MAEAARDTLKELHDFLAWENGQPDRWERLGGAARMMTGGTAAHAVIAVNVGSALRNALRGRPCRVYSSDMKVVTGHDDVLYPDVSVSCGPFDPRATWCPDPVLVVEVLSPFTAADDYGRKRLSYQSIPSLQHYLVVAQDRPQVELFTRQQDGAWLAQAAEGLEAVVRLAALEIDLRLADLFEDVAAEGRGTGEITGR